MRIAKWQRHWNGERAAEKKTTTENNIKECKSKWVTKKKSIRNAQNNTQTTKVTNEK